MTDLNKKYYQELQRRCRSDKIACLSLSPISYLSIANERAQLLEPAEAKEDLLITPESSPDERMALQLGKKLAQVLGNSSGGSSNGNNIPNISSNNNSLGNNNFMGSGNNNNNINNNSISSSCMESPLAVAMPTTPTPTPAAAAAAAAAKAAATPTTTLSAATATAVAVTTPRLDSPLGNGGELFNIAKAKKVELQNLSSRFQAAVSQTNSATSASAVAVAAEAGGGGGGGVAGELLMSFSGQVHAFICSFHIPGESSLAPLQTH